MFTFTCKPVVNRPLTIAGISDVKDMANAWIQGQRVSLSSQTDY